MSRYRLILGTAVLLFTNGVALVSVAWNRSSGPIQTIVLTEREAPIVSSDNPDDSSVSLRLEWRLPSRPEENPLDEAKLKEIGFQCPPPGEAAPYAPRLPPREAFIVLKLDGMGEDRGQAGRGDGSTQPSESPSQEPDAQPRRGEAPRPPTRLTVVDAASGYEPLRTRYPGPQAYMIVRALVGAGVARPAGDNALGAPGRPRWTGRVLAAIPPSLHVPLPLSRSLDVLKKDPARVGRYRVTLHYGRRMEPWVGNIEVLPK